MNIERKKHFMKKTLEKLRIAHFWCSFSKKEKNFLHKLSIYLCPMQNEIEAKTMLELDAMINEEDDMKINIESTIFTKKELKIVSSAIITSLASCASCVLKYKEYVIINSNEDLKVFFEEIEQKRCKQGLEDKTSQLVMFEILLGNWEFIVDYNNRMMWYKRIELALNDNICPERYTFSITCMLLGNHILYNYAKALTLYFFESNRLFLHTTNNEWNFLIQLYSEFLYNNNFKEKEEKNMLEFVHIYILVEGTYVKNDIIELLTLHYNETKEEAVKFKIFVILVSLNKKIKLVEDAVKSILVDITETLLFQEYTKKNYEKKIDGYMIRFDEMDYIIESFTLYCNFALEKLIFEVYEFITDINFYDKALEHIVKNIQNVTMIADLMGNSLFFTQICKKIMIRYLHNNISQNHNRIFLKKCANITVENTYKIFETNYYVKVHKIYHAWNEIVLYILKEQKDNKKYEDLYIFFIPFIEMFFYDISPFFARNNPNFYSLYMSYKQSVLKYIMIVNCKMKLNDRIEMYKNFIIDKNHLFLHLNNTKIMLNQIVSFIDKYNIIITCLDSVLNYVTQEIFDFDILTSLMYLAKYLDNSTNTINNYINKMNTKITAKEIFHFLTYLKEEKCDAKKLRTHLRFLYKKVKYVTKERNSKIKTETDTKKILKSLRQHIKDNNKGEKKRKNNTQKYNNTNNSTDTIIDKYEKDYIGDRTYINNEVDDITEGSQISDNSLDMKCDEDLQNSENDSDVNFDSKNDSNENFDSKNDSNVIFDSKNDSNHFGSNENIDNTVDNIRNNIDNIDEYNTSSIIDSIEFESNNNDKSIRKNIIKSDSKATSSKDKIPKSKVNNFTIENKDFGIDRYECQYKKQTQTNTDNLANEKLKKTTETNNTENQAKIVTDNNTIENKQPNNTIRDSIKIKTQNYYMHPIIKKLPVKGQTSLNKSKSERIIDLTQKFVVPTLTNNTTKNLVWQDSNSHTETKKPCNETKMGVQHQNKFITIKKM